MVPFLNVIFSVPAKNHSSVFAMNNSFDFPALFWPLLHLNDISIFPIHDISTLAMNDIFVFVKAFKDLIIFNGNL